MNDTSELTTTLTSIRTEITALQGIPGTVKSLQDQFTQLNDQLATLRRQSITRSLITQPRIPGVLSDECARQIAASFVLHCYKSGMLEAISSASHHRDSLLSAARAEFNITTRAALTEAEVPLPTEYGREVRGLISDFGVVRKKMTHYPIGLGTAKPARMGTRPAFGAIAMSSLIPEKSPTFTLASLESHKIGGMVRLPRELDEQSLVSMGHFLGTYAAVEFARAEDNFAFMADGTENFDGINGIAAVAEEGGHIVTLAAGKTKPSDVTLTDLRNVRLEVNKAALSGRRSCYYVDSTWEAKLPSFNSADQPNVYIRLPDGSAMLDGYPIVWTDVLEPYGVDAAAAKVVCVFGALGFWWFAEHGSPRIDTSGHVFFQNDQLAVRCLEEIDVDYMAQDATAILKLPAE